MKRALLVGINKYPSAPLAGCVNDVFDVANLLVKKFNFRKKDIRLLVDRRANTVNIRRHIMQWLVKPLRSGDLGVYHFSGHGTHVPTHNKAEPDGLLEVSCPCDFDWSRQRMITDKQYVNMFRRLRKGVKFLWVSDSCHSGDLTRSMPPKDNPSVAKALPRFMPPPRDIGWDIEALKEEGKEDLDEGVAERAMIRNKLGVQFISGCKSNQTSADAVFNGRWNGALTYYLIRRLRTLPIHSGQPQASIS
jgi:hypothetical protein